MTDIPYNHLLYLNNHFNEDELFALEKNEKCEKKSSSKSANQIVIDLSDDDDDTQNNNKENEESVEALNIISINSIQETTESIKNDANGKSVGMRKSADSNQNDDDVQLICVKYETEPQDDEIEVLSQSLPPEEVFYFMKKRLRFTVDVTKLTYTSVRVLLNYFNWQKEVLIEYYFNNMLHNVLQNEKLVIPDPISYGKRKRILNDDDGNSTDVFQCLICFDDVAKDKIASEFPCQHYCCEDCWIGYIENMVNDASSNDRVTCPSDGCNRLIEDEVIFKLLKNSPKVKAKFQRLITKKFVEFDPLIKWCPNGSCTHAIKVKNNYFQDVECAECKAIFCYLCSEDWHEPLPCSMHKEWIERYSSQTIDPRSAAYLLENTKNCPKCAFPIEKNGGCNYVCCTKCKHAFCFYCLGKCTHGRCTGADRPDAVEARAKHEVQRMELTSSMKFPQVKKIYEEQSRKLKTEQDLMVKIIEKIDLFKGKTNSNNMQQHHDWDLRFVKYAFGVLCHCRKTLVYANVFNYFIVGPQNMIDVYNSFVFQLEGWTNNLWLILYNETSHMTKNELPVIKKRTQEAYRQCESARISLVDFVRNGFTDIRMPTKHPNLIWRFIHFENQT